MPKLYHKSTCSTCRNAKAFLKDQGVEAEERDLSKEPLAVPEVDALIGERPLKPFLNTRTEEYRERGYAKNPPSREEALERLSANTNLLRRPLLILDNGHYLHGFNETEWRAALQGS